MGDVKGTMFSEALSLRHKKSQQLHKQEAAANLGRQLLFVTTAAMSLHQMAVNGINCWSCQVSAAGTAQLQLSFPDWQYREDVSSF